MITLSASAAGCTTLAHRNDFCIDESGMRPTIHAFIAYVMNLQK